MEIFYQRQETEKEVIITFLAFPILHVFFWLVVFLSLLSLGSLTSIAFGAFVISLVIYLGLSWRVIREINQAMLNKGVMVIGSQFSFKYPMKIIIEK